MLSNNMAFSLEQLGMDPAVASAVLLGMGSALVILVVFAAVLYMSNGPAATKASTAKKASGPSGTVMVQEGEALVRRSSR